MADREFRKLLVDIACQLDRDTVEMIAYLCNLPRRTDRSGAALGVLQELQERGHIPSENVEPLIKILRDVSRYDLADYVADFEDRRKYRVKLGKQKRVRLFRDGIKDKIVGANYVRFREYLHTCAANKNLAGMKNQRTKCVHEVVETKIRTTSSHLG